MEIMKVIKSGALMECDISVSDLPMCFKEIDNITLLYDRYYVAYKLHYISIYLIYLN